MVVFWKEDSGRQPPLITSENEGGYETNSPSPPKFTFFDDPDVPFRPRPRGPFDQPRGPYPEPQDPPDPPDNPGFQPGLPPAPPPPAGGERTTTVDQSRERLRISRASTYSHSNTCREENSHRLLPAMRATQNGRQKLKKEDAVSADVAHPQQSHHRHS